MNTDKGTAKPVEPTWLKSSYSGSGGGNCVEIAIASSTVGIRDSKDTAGPVLHVRDSAWSAFVTFATTRPGRAT
ncbi:DUF397 domain-containing protein [Streptomyces sp. NPDC058653]|uniref:DUF397 domain-containing protein n=1 Tax=Streptomyces sp. NPDC058653 TaxID=3346576 RepID=UPI0036473EF2